MAYSVAVILASLVHLLLTLEMAAATATFQYPLGLRRVLNCNRNAEVREDCDPDSYKITVLTHAGPAFAMACLVALTVLLYLTCKYIFNCCGGRKQTPNLCCPLNNHPARYDTGDILRPVVHSVLAFCVAVASCTWGCLSLQRLYEHQGMLRNLSNSAVERMDSRGAELLDGMTFEMYNANEDSTFNTSLLDLNENGGALRMAQAERSAELSRMLNTTIIALVDHTESLSYWPYVVFISPAILSFLGVICALCNCRRYIPMALLVVMSLFCISAWILNGMFASYSFLMGESCFEVSEFSSRRTNVLKAVSDCNDTKFDQHTAKFEALFREQSQITCKAILPHCYVDSMTPSANVDLMQVFSCPTSMSCTDVSDADMVSWLGTAFQTSPKITQDAAVNLEAQNKGYTCASTLGGVCDLKSCAKKCTLNDDLSDVGKSAKAAVYAITGVARAKSVFDFTGRQLGSCNALLKDLVPPLNPSCKVAADASRQVMHAFGLLGSATIVSLFAYGLGAKRFIPFSQALLPQRG